MDDTILRMVATIRHMADAISGMQRIRCGARAVRTKYQGQIDAGRSRNGIGMIGDEFLMELIISQILKEGSDPFPFFVKCGEIETLSGTRRIIF